MRRSASRLRPYLLRRLPDADQADLGTPTGVPSVEPPASILLLLSRAEDQRAAQCEAPAPFKAGLCAIGIVIGTSATRNDERQRQHRQAQNPHERLLSFVRRWRTVRSSAASA